MKRWLSPLIVALSIVASTAWPAYAADTTQQQLAQALFEEGRRLMDQGRFGEACPKLAESQRLDPGGGTILNLALCHEREGKLATAKAEYEEALRFAVQARRSDREALARERIAAIERQLPRLTVVVPAETASLLGLEVKLDGVVLPREAWGVAMGVDPGARALEASADGYERWSSSVSVGPGQRETIEVPTLAPAHRWVGGIGVGALALEEEAQPESKATPAPAPAPAPDVRMKPNPLYLLSSGIVVAGGATAGVTGIIALIQRFSAADGCIPERSYCYQEASKSTADRAATMAWISTITLGVAAVGAVGMVVLPARTSEPRVRPSASLAPGGGGSLGLSGSF